MTTRNAPCDVFLSYNPINDVGWAADVQAQFERQGLVVYNIANTKPGEDVSESTWDALAESAALVALISQPRSESPNLLFEIGASMTWEKPVFVLYKGERPAGLPRYISDARITPATHIDEVAKKLREDSAPLPEAKRHLLTKLYLSLGVPTDQLLNDPAKADRLTHRFNQLAHASLSSQLLLRELLRLRKSGTLPTVISRMPKRHRGTVRTLPVHAPSTRV